MRVSVHISSLSRLVGAWQCRPARTVGSDVVMLTLVAAFLLPHSNAWAVFAGNEPDPRPQNAGSILGIQQGDEIVEARQLLKAKKWAEAAILLSSALRKNWSTSGASDLARALVFSGRREDALTVLGQALGPEKSTRVRRSLIAKSRVFSRISDKRCVPDPSRRRQSHDGP